jgi:hypothetical protein
MTLHSIVTGLTFALSLTGVGAAQDPSPAVVTTARFALRSDPRVALHHVLLDWASADAGEWPAFAVPLAEREAWRSVLDPGEQRVWTAR